MHLTVVQRIGSNRSCDETFTRLRLTLAPAHLELIEDGDLAVNAGVIC